MNSVVTISVAALSGYMAISTVRSHLEAYSVLRAIRPRHFGFAVVSFVATLAICVSLWATHIEWLNWSWWNAIGGSGGNLYFGATHGTGTVGVILGVVVAATVLLGLPALVMAEEIGYRAGSETDSVLRRLRRAIGFGLWHVTVGVPLSVAFALSVAGLVFTGVYLRGYRRAGESTTAEERAGSGVVESTLTHLIHNVLALSLFAVALLTR